MLTLICLLTKTSLRDLSICLELFLSFEMCPCLSQLLLLPLKAFPLIPIRCLRLMLWHLRLLKMFLVAFLKFMLRS